MKFVVLDRKDQLVTYINATCLSQAISIYFDMSDGSEIFPDISQVEIFVSTEGLHIRDFFRVYEHLFLDHKEKE